jgi:competence protein ComEC
MPWYDRSIDLLVLTHPHADHLDGLISVLDRYQVGAIIESGVEYPTADYAKWHELIAAKKTKTILAARGERVDLGDGVTLEVLARLLTGAAARRKTCMTPWW